MTPEQDQRLKEIAEEVEAIRSDTDDDIKTHAEKYLVELYDLLQSTIAERDGARREADIWRSELCIHIMQSGGYEGGVDAYREENPFPWEKDAT